MKQILKFPEHFLWGAATAAHQVEGMNTNSDWWAWEHSKKREQFLISHGKDPTDYYSGKACDSYHRFDEDFALAQKLHHNATRLSIEWARIEPEEGKFDETALDHYEQVLKTAKAHGLATFVTLHHFTSPIWFMKKGGFTKRENNSFFIKYARYATKRLSEYVDFWLTFNEPEMYSTHSYWFGIYPPQVKSMRAAFNVVSNIIISHNVVAEFIRHEIKKPVSMAYHLSDIQPYGILGNVVASLAHYMANEYIINRTIQTCDYIGLNYYNHHHLGILGTRHHSHSGHELNDLGWGIHPEGLERVLLKLKKYQKPIYITENGLADAKDIKREKFIHDHVWYIHKALEQKVDVRGYLHWSLLDNFEWEKGFKPRFGLIEIDRGHGLERKIRPSALAYAEICKNNELIVEVSK